MLGPVHESALPPFPFGAILSARHYPLAGQQGEVEADMVPSEWFLWARGAEGTVDKDENLAFTFAEKARKGRTEFAMEYYKEIGVGGSEDIDAARMRHKDG